MSRRRILPDAAYDFFARDGRADPDGPMRDTIEEARADATKIRASIHSWSRAAITVEWVVNEKKVLRLLRKKSR